MFSKYVLIFFTALALTASCNSKQTTQRDITNADLQKPNEIIPVTQFILAQLKEIDTLPLTPLKIITINGKDDSAWMKKEDIRIFAQPFLKPVIDSANCTGIFQQHSFLDETINAFTFSYDAVPGKLPADFPLKKWDVYLSPETNAIKRVYLVKEFKDGNIVQTQQLTWLSGRWCKITYIKETNGIADIREEKMIWDFKED